ncbi:MAG: hypothetical protein ABEJ69_00055 [Candidatus Nanohaloarchaea archaeon]
MDEKTVIVVAAFYLLAAVVFTWPASTQISTHVIGDGGDSLQNMWNLWWVEKAVSGPEKLYFTDYLFYPEGASLAFHTLSPANTLFLGLPLFFLTGSFLLSYNILILLSFVLSGYGMYLLVRYLTGEWDVAVLAGFAYSFSPYHLAQSLGHLNLASIQWLPFFILFYLKMLREDGWRNPVLAAAFLLLLSLSSWQYLLVAVVLGGVIYVHEALTGRWRDMRLHGRLSLFSLSFLLAVSPFAAPMIRRFLDGVFPGSGRSFSMITLENYLTPSKMHPLWGRSFASFYPPNISDSTVFLGYTLLAFSVLHVLKNRKKARPWIFSSVIFALLSIKPNVLHDIFSMIFPPFRVMSNMERFALGTVFSVTVMFAFGVKEYMPRLTEFTGVDRVKVMALLLGIVALEFLVVPYYSTAVKPVPDEIERMGEEDENFTVLNVPPLYNSPAMYLQTVHGKKMLGGYLSRTPERSLETLRDLRSASRRGRVQEVRSMVERLRVRYLISYPDFSPDYGMNLSRIPGQLRTALVYNTSRLKVYRVENQPS